MRIKKFLRIRRPGHLVRIGKMKIRTPLTKEIPTREDEKFLENAVVGKIETAEILTENDLKKEKRKEKSNKDNYNQNGNVSQKKTESVIQKKYTVEDLEDKESVIDVSSPEWAEDNKDVVTPLPSRKKNIRKKKKHIKKKSKKKVGDTNFSYLRRDTDSNSNEDDFEDYCYEEEYTENGGFKSDVG